MFHPHCSRCLSLYLLPAFGQKCGSKISICQRYGYGHGVSHHQVDIKWFLCLTWNRTSGIRRAPRKSLPHQRSAWRSGKEDQDYCVKEKLEIMPDLNHSVQDPLCSNQSNNSLKEVSSGSTLLLSEQQFSKRRKILDTWHSKRRKQIPIGPTQSQTPSPRFCQR